MHVCMYVHVYFFFSRCMSIIFTSFMHIYTDIYISTESVILILKGYTNWNFINI